MSQVTGIVQEVNNRGKGKGSNIMVNGVKYGCFDPVQAGITTLQAGQGVTFATSVNGTYVNIHGAATPTGVTAPVTAAPPAAAAPAASGSGGGYKGGSDFVFPIPELNYQRSVTRRESIRDAVLLVNEMCSGMANDMPLPDRVSQVLEAARAFEDYSCGDDIEREATAAVAALGTSEATQ